MNIKIIIYLITLPITMWGVSSLRIENIFKKNSINQIKTFYLLIAICITYIVTQFIYDFYQITALSRWKEITCI